MTPCPPAPPPPWRAWRQRAARWLLVCASLAGAGAQARDVRVGLYSNEPKIFANTAGQPSGILGDLLQEIARQEGWTLVPVPCTWQACLEAVQAGQIDLMPDVAYSEQRAAQFDFHQTPSLHSWSQVYQRGDLQLSSMLALHDKRIAVLAGSVQQDYLEKLLSGFGVHARLVPVNTLQEGFEKVAAQEVDAAVANRFYGDLHAARYRLDATSIMFLPSQLFYATGRGRNADLLSAIDRHLDEWKSRPDSRYYQVLARWMGAQPTLAIPVQLWWGLASLLLLLLLALAGGALLRRQVAEKTRHLRASEDKLAVILNSVDAHIYIKDTQRRYQYANRKTCELFKRSPDDVVGHTDAEFFDAATDENLKINDLRVLEQGERVEEEEVNQGLDGAPTRTYLSVKLPLRHPDGSIYALCGISTDITRHKEAEKAIHQLAFYDALTGLPNRRLLMERLQLALLDYRRHPQGGALLFIDIDNFKDINDTLGHDMGDQLLQQSAERLRACMREADTLARQGGDEFVAVLLALSPHMDLAVQQAGAVARAVLQRLAEPYPLDCGVQQASVSIGVAMFTDPGLTREELLKQADLAMYRAKAEGRNRLCFFDPQMQAQVSARTQLDADLHQALGSGQFLLHYQPQVDRAGHWLGAEALVRWQHPQRCMVPPGEFIAAAEANGLILPLGRWILQAACLQLKAWHQQAHTAHWCMAVNVSARELQSPDYVASVLAILEATGAPASGLELEITESHLVHDVSGAIAKMNALKAHGVRFSLDDFGTGYSSLNMLQRLPLDRLKIDQSFVAGLLTDAHSTPIVKAIITLGQSMGLDVIAEGVETPAQRDALQALGCTLFQGYLFGRPQPLPPAGIRAPT